MKKLCLLALLISAFSFANTVSNTNIETKEEHLKKMITDFYDVKEPNIVKLEKKDGEVVGIVKKDLDDITKGAIMFKIEEATGVITKIAESE